VVEVMGAASCRGWRRVVGRGRIAAVALSHRRDRQGA
jgi:hypothetical protein